MAAEVSFEQEGSIEKRACGETRSRRRLRAFSQCAGSTPSGGLRVPIPCTKEKGGAIDCRSGRGQSRVGCGFRGQVLVESAGFARL
jgi:hypothetical protein